MPATPEQLTQLQWTNELVNAIPFVSDSPVFGEFPDTWKMQPDGKGFVCRDYTQAKANILCGKGWSPLAMSVVLCWTEPLDGYPDGEYHAVLWVDVDGETWVLDNRVAQVYRWDQPPYPYRWNWRQVAGTDEFLSIAS
jgi:predicted transglutaminase-like cysteine proteinase